METFSLLSGTRLERPNSGLAANELLRQAVQSDFGCMDSAPSPSPIDCFRLAIMRPASWRPPPSGCKTVTVAKKDLRA